ncbi:MAG TPA: RsmG family class I SAM-dependent methyltransferase [Thermoanaerobaculia bacterium]|nr:RsmG family class I SAM-dependent methyltransferase [Thermoanaerobaculia bacterium]
MSAAKRSDLEHRIVETAARFPEPHAAAIERAAADLARYLGLLLQFNETTNLVSASAARPDVLVGQHLFESLLGLPLLPSPHVAATFLLDIGSGGGFPAVPLLTVRRDLSGVLVESTGKKARFLSKVAAELNLTLEVVNARFPASFPMDTKRHFDIVTTRAVASAGLLVRKAKPFLALRARALLWTTEELAEAAAKELGIHTFDFHRSPIAEARGIARFECST